jgi:uncharacterized protein (DUF2236 family)
VSGLFSPDSVTRRVNRESVLLLGGGRALLMQLAHPGVAAGVAEHSNFRQRPVHRLLRTLGLTLALTFGPREQALAAAREINRTHQRVRGTGYSAMDPRLLLWVHATLIDSTLVGYQTFVGPLSRAEQETYYREAQVIGPLLGLPAGAYPADLAAFERYLVEMRRRELVVDDRARELAAAVLHPPQRALTGGPLAAMVTAALLPEELRAAYRLAYGRRERLAFGLLRSGLPRLVQLLPARVRYAWPTFSRYPER